MNNATLKELAGELSAELEGRRLRKIQQISEFALALDFRLKENRQLYVSINTSSPQIFLSRRILNTNEKPSFPPSQFVLALKKELQNATITNVEKVEGDRIVKLHFACDDEHPDDQTRILAVKLTGRSSDLLLLDSAETILAKFRPRTRMRVGQIFSVPDSPKKTIIDETVFPRGNFPTLSDALEAHFLAGEAEQTFGKKISRATETIRAAIASREKLANKLLEDLARHGNADHWKRLGDIILANLATARIENKQIFVTDHFDEAAPEIGIDVHDDLSPKELAEYFFKRYAKSRNAEREISRRLAEIESELRGHYEQKKELELAIERRDEKQIERFLPPKAAERKTRAVKPDERSPRCARKFVSSDGMEILVGKVAKDNDELTFKIAKSMDWWFHAADYAGSHVVVRNPTRKELPQKTFLEAAHLAAFYSQARKHPKAAVHYTQKKFVSKPRRAAPGLVRLAKFKTILVEPRIPFAAIEPAK